MSYGGSSVLVTFIALGLLQSIYIQARIAVCRQGQGAHLDVSCARAPATSHVANSRAALPPRARGRTYIKGLNDN